MIYAIGDIHGQRALLKDVLTRIEADGGAGARVVFLGDYVDRGPDSAGVLDLLCDGRDAGRDWVLLKGNHDRMFEWFLEPEPRHDPYLLIGYHWLHDRLGGLETLASYDIYPKEAERQYRLAERVRASVPLAHQDLLRGLRLMHREPGLVFVHAGIRPGVPLAEQEETDLLWIRQEFHNDGRDHGALVVHGHTPVKRVEHHGNRLNLDTGAAYGGPLSCAVFEDGKVWELTREGRVPLKPKGIFRR